MVYSLLNQDKFDPNKELYPQVGHLIQPVMLNEVKHLNLFAKREILHPAQNALFRMTAPAIVMLNEVKHLNLFAKRETLHTAQNTVFRMTAPAIVMLNEVKHLNLFAKRETLNTAQNTMFRMTAPSIVMLNEVKHLSSGRRTIAVIMCFPKFSLTASSTFRSQDGLPVSL